jgi:hypothetical protein
MIEYLDRPPAGWFVAAVIPEKERSRLWVALMTDTDPKKLRESWPLIHPRECVIRIPRQASQPGSCLGYAPGHAYNPTLTTPKAAARYIRRATALSFSRSGHRAAFRYQSNAGIYTYKSPTTAIMVAAAVIQMIMRSPSFPGIGTWITRGTPSAL